MLLSKKGKTETSEYVQTDNTLGKDLAPTLNFPTGNEMSHMPNVSKDQKDSAQTLNFTMMVDELQKSLVLMKEILQKVAIINSAMFGHEKLKEEDSVEPGLPKGGAVASYYLTTQIFKKLEQISAHLGPMLEFTRG